MLELFARLVDLGEKFEEHIIVAGRITMMVELLRPRRSIRERVDKRVCNREIT